MIYLDKPQLRRLRFGRWQVPGWYYVSHCISDESVEELHAFMAEIAVLRTRRGFHNKPGAPHYDLVEGLIRRAREAGAREVGSRELVAILRRRYGGPLSGGAVEGSGEPGL